MRIVSREPFAPVVEGATVRYEPATHPAAAGVREVAHLEILRSEFA
jgi:hypothetical protein